jgi:hypothetical protein
VLGLHACLGGIAQLVERLVRNQQVRGSNPLASKAKSVRQRAASQQTKVIFQIFLRFESSGQIV